MWPFKKKPQPIVNEVELVIHSDPALREQLLAEIIRQQGESDASPIVSLDSFFAGNEDFGSIGCNLSPLLGPRFFHETLKAIRTRSEVQEVLVEISDANENDPDPTIWPFSDQVYVVTSASAEDVASWVAPLQPDEVSTDYVNSRLNELPLGPGMVSYRVWWD